MLMVNLLDNVDGNNSTNSHYFYSKCYIMFYEFLYINLLKLRDT